MRAHGVEKRIFFGLLTNRQLIGRDPAGTHRHRRRLIGCDYSFLRLYRCARQLSVEPAIAGDFDRVIKFENVGRVVEQAPRRDKISLLLFRVDHLTRDAL